VQGGRLMVAPVDKDPAMLFFGRDFYEDEAVRLMSLEQEAIYLRLLWHAWREGSIPADATALAALLRIPARRFEKLWPGVAVKWHPTGDGSRLTNNRQERERQQRLETKERFRAGARLANAKRWGERSPSDPREGRLAVASEAQAQAQEGTEPRAPRATPPSRPEDVSEQTWTDWTDHRRKKRASASQTAIATLRKQAEAAGMTLQEAMAHCVSQGHQGFFPPDKKPPRLQTGQWNAPPPPDIKPPPSVLHNGLPDCPCDRCGSERRRRQAQ
jgi:uncharacterized protein YdaU (DUF1376 family)